MWCIFNVLYDFINSISPAKVLSMQSFIKRVCYILIPLYTLGSFVRLIKFISTQHFKSDGWCTNVFWSHLNGGLFYCPISDQSSQQPSGQSLHGWEGTQRFSYCLCPEYSHTADAEVCVVVVAGEGDHLFGGTNASSIVPRVPQHCQTTW